MKHLGIAIEGRIKKLDRNKKMDEENKSEEVLTGTEQVEVEATTGTEITPEDEEII